MTMLAHVTTLFAYYLLNVIQLAMLVRAIMSWISPDADGGLIRLLYALTEPFVGFVRGILHRLHVGVDGPLDFSFLLTVILLSLGQWILGALL